MPYLATHKAIHFVVKPTTQKLSRNNCMNSRLCCEDGMLESGIQTQVQRTTHSVTYSVSHLFQTYGWKTFLCCFPHYYFAFG